MTEQSYVIKSPEGVHARPAGFLVKTASEFNCDIQISCKGKSACAKKMLSIIKLGIKKGDTVYITTEGDDEIQAAASIIAFFKEHF